jgi:glycerol uptake facilitator-like aquaporin
LIVSALLFGGISGAVLNPAVGMLALFGFVHADKGVPVASWVFFVAPFIASAAASFVFRHQSPRDHAPRQALMRGPVDHPEHHKRGSELGYEPTSLDIQ